MESSKMGYKQLIGAYLYHKNAETLFYGLRISMSFAGVEYF